MMIKKILTIILLSILAFNVTALDIISVDTNNATLNRTNWTNSTISVKDVIVDGISMKDSLTIPISIVASGSVVTITHVSQETMYSITATSPTTITNDFSNISTNCTKITKWLVKYNATVTNACSILWDARTEWVGLYSSTPDLTVTGRYEFAFSTSDGVTIQGRQTYPTVYAWGNIKYANYGATTYTHDYTYSALTTAQTNFNVIAETDANASYCLVKISGRANSITNIFSIRLRIERQGVGFLTSIDYTNTVTPVATSNYPYVTILGTAGYTSDGYNHYAYYLSFLRDSRREAVTIRDIKSKTMNEIEKAHFLAGGRDFK